MKDVVQLDTRHGPMFALRGDQYVTRSLALYGEFSGLEWALLEQLASSGSAVVEVGANIGAHTIPLARRCAPGPLIAFEPQQRVYQLLCANVALNGLDNVFAHAEALGEAEGHAVLPRVDYGADLNFGGVAVGADGEAGVRVRMTTLDSLALPACDLLKIDVEGHEAAVLRGAARTIARHRPVLYLENDRDDRKGEVIATVHGLGYRMYWHAPPLFNPRNPRGVQDNVFGTVGSLNMLCLPAEQDVDMGGMAAVDPHAWT